MAMKITKVDGSPVNPAQPLSAPKMKVPMQDRKKPDRVLRRDLDDLARQVNSAIEGLTSRVMTDRKRNEELIEERMKYSPHSKAMQVWQSDVDKVVTGCHQAIRAMAVEWNKLRAEMAGNHAARTKVYKELQSRIAALESRPTAVTAEQAVNLPVVMQQLSQLRESFMVMSPMEAKAMLDCAIRALGGKA